MTVQTKATLKGYFNTGDTPSEANFAALVDTIGQTSLVVAASNASDASKGRADYVCDGTADESEINTAIGALPAVGGDIYLTEGLFTIADAGSGYGIYINASNVRLHLNAGTTLKLKDNEISGTDVCNLIRIGDGTNAVTNITITGPGIIDGNIANNPSTGDINTGALVYAFGPNEHIRLDRLTIQNATRDAICINGSPLAITPPRANDVWVTRCFVTDCAEGIVWIKANNVHVVGNTIDTTTDQDAIEPASYCDYWWIEDNSITGIDATDSAIDIYAYDGACSHGVVANNVIYTCGNAYYIAVGVANDALVSDVLVCGNVLIGGGIMVGTDTGLTKQVRIEGNEIIDATLYGIYVDQYASGVSIVNNTITGCQNAGVGIAANNVEVSNNRVFNNGNNAALADQLQSGVYDSGVTGSQIVGNRIYDDRGGSATQTYSVYIASTTNAFVTGNYFAGHTVNDQPVVTSATGQLVANNFPAP